MPLSCHLMLTAGPRAALGLLSPSDRAIERGDPFTTAFGVWGALTCRAGFVVADAAELPDGIEDYVERLVAPYFEAIAEWYTALRVGQTGGTLQDDRRPPSRRPVLRDLPQPRAPAPPRRVGGIADRARARRSSCARARRCRPTSSRPPARPGSRPTSRTASRSRTSRSATSWRARDPAALATHPGATGLHARRAGHRAARGRAAALEHPGLAAAVPARHGPGHDAAGGLTAVRAAGRAQWSSAISFSVSFSMGLPRMIMPRTWSVVTSALFTMPTIRAVVHDRDPVREVEDIVDVVADEEDADAFALQLADEVAHLRGLGRPEGRGGLVHDEDARVEVDRPGDRHGLTLAAGERHDRLGEVREVGVEAPMTLRVAFSMAPSSSVPEARRCSRARGRRCPAPRCCRPGRASGRSSRSGGSSRHACCGWPGPGRRR